MLGGSEIRVFSPRGQIYAAPTLIYHYINTHHYDPPDEFMRALYEGPAAGSREYFDRLKELGLEWTRTSSPATKTAWFRFEPQGSQPQQAHV